MCKTLDDKIVKWFDTLINQGYSIDAAEKKLIKDREVYFGHLSSIGRLESSIREHGIYLQCKQNGHDFTEPTDDSGSVMCKKCRVFDWIK
ncbi:TPA: hypothetical protein ACGW7B_001797 [Bacillus nitratireducens]|nr:hypothetical protein bcere0029_10330 [Bacillus cereus AH1272]EEL94942.1 hypothetical protein bcere0030_10490 [Bacillus cereus AH1273]GCF73387.1 hypothetical protein BC2926_09280 [Bacillus cereus]